MRRQVQVEYALSRRGISDSLDSIIREVIADIPDATKDVHSGGILILLCGQRPRPCHPQAVSRGGLSTLLTASAATPSSSRPIVGPRHKSWAPTPRMPSTAAACS